MAKGELAQAAWDAFTEEEKVEIRANAARKIEAYDNLQGLRKAAGLTQAKVSEELGMPPSNVSRLEKGSDMLLSTLRNYVQAVGGKLNLIVELPNKPPIALSSLGDLMEQPNPDKDMHP